ncbi:MULTISPECIES: acetoin dehydrogenase dihydrolipoyllysine-residue acetyltransferase subunit [unclassified Caballeronia]|uniref:acetoin dehydrogenase dihydrolipoyllysine-residue acetyltransferase subunit n=1 Tax=unclassified Caballeronia TaxID=2646786 RepID=UPI00285C6FBC|nr:MULTISPECIES: acetoin dehydrogenase dihydrolipoyllysine-residue acetyltransferase subunit [unclassified Caballeronia]MDR5773731.1 acetoin dehydrogenase dihydrolipoyllysine-residue acetyltransferase subunit [Caballeronia sp. LZ002]MDR5849166.1 acetoin dehydrogenase dihydrolipoyllysine-residue acetyltransferase subunit [Caballeronia sp. LZ003]
MPAITPIVMPKWGLSMKEGTVNEWLVEEGAQIAVGMPILDVETDKIANAVEAPDAGTLRRRVASAGDTLPVKALLGVLAPAEVSDADIDAYVSSYETPPDEEGEGDEAASAYHFVDVDGIRVRYAARGGDDAGKSAVLFIHGFGGDLDNWLFNLDALAEHNRVFALDLPGHGQSTPKVPGTTLADLARFIANFMDAVNIEKAHLVGHSMGGGIAAQLAVDAPARVQSVALVSPSGFGDEVNNAYTEGFVSAQSRRELKPVVELLFANPELVSRQMLDDLLKYKRLDGVSEALTALGGALFGGGRQSGQPGRKLEESGKPVLVIWGAKDQIIPAAHAENAPKHATVRIFDDAGHMSQMEKANEVNALLKEHVGKGV